MNLSAVLLISRDDVLRHISMQDVLMTVENVFRYEGQGQVASPPKSTMDLRSVGIDGHNHAMPSYVIPLEAAGVKWVSGYAQNPQQYDLPYIISTIILQEPLTGYPLTIMEGAYITNLRTGASAAVCAKYYARQDTRTGAFIGTGTQARFALNAMTHVFDFADVRAYDIRPEASQAFADEMSKNHDLKVQACNSIEEAVTGADVILTATFADEPLVRGTWLNPGSTSISIGSYQEFDDHAVRQADKIAVDSWEQCMHRGELKRFAECKELTRDHIFAEVGDTVAEARPGRENDSERILVVPMGLGSHDIAIAKLIYDRVRNAGHGTAFRFL